MNYRHIYHAGNFADVVKHLVLVLCLDHLRKKDAPFFVLDAQGGCGRYDLNSVEAQKTREYEPGIGSLFRHCDPGLEPGEAIQKKEWIAAFPPVARNDIELYINLVREDWTEGHYPGSPLIAARMLRARDRLLANELHPEDAGALRQSLRPFKNAQVSAEDAYQCLRAQLPPTERRGLVLIDPPYEIETAEHEIVIRQMREWKKRWANGTYILWYPVKDNFPVAALEQAAVELGLPRTWACVYSGANLPPLPSSDRGDRKRLRSTGLIVFNAPYQVPERAMAALTVLSPALGGQAESRWLVPDNIIGDTLN